MKSLNPYPEFYTSTTPISRESLSNLANVLSDLRDEDGLPIGINPANILQEWIIEMYPEAVKTVWKKIK
jgi:hypothetical protein